MEQVIRFCGAPDGVRLAYASYGQGPVIVKAAHWLTHLEYDWRSPVWRHWLDGLGIGHRVVRYDERGCGLSDRDPERLTLDAFVEDLAPVVNAAGLDQFALLGASQGAAVAIGYAVRHPERVSHLALVGGYARGSARRAASAEAREETDAEELPFPDGSFDYVLSAIGVMFTPTRNGRRVSCCGYVGRAAGSGW